MVDYLENSIRTYEVEAVSFTTSPIDNLQGLIGRIIIEENYDELTFEEKLRVHLMDVKVLQYAKEIVEYQRGMKSYGCVEIYPLEHWWFHLDKIDNMKIELKVSIGRS